MPPRLPAPSSPPPPKAIVIVRPERLSVHVTTANFIFPDWKSKTNAVASFHFGRLAGAAPFQAKTDSARHRRILTADLKFRADFHLHAKDLVSKLCVVNLSHRLGMQLRGMDDVKDHAFWTEDWDAVARRETKPPVKPEMRRAEVLTRLEPLRGVTTTVEMDRVTPEEDAVFAGYY